MDHRESKNRRGGDFRHAPKNLTKKPPDLRLGVAQQGDLYEAFAEIGFDFHVDFGAPTAKTLG
jgi:hypothetical protein